MFKNPEFIRNTWTELTAKKLAAMPLLLITVYLLAYILDEALPFSFLPYICVFFYCVFTYVWSTRLAAETVIREINANTWSFQVMTSMSPVKMAVGKLFGSTIYIWYGNFICFALYLLSYHLHRERLPEVPLQLGSVRSVPGLRILRRPRRAVRALFPGSRARACSSRPRRRRAG